jgi:predicted outer membrane repeat protein
MHGLSARRSLSVLAVTTCALLGSTAVASAGTFTVNDSTDAALSNVNDTSCVSTDGGSCTLRAAVQAADNSGGTSQITVPAGTYRLTIPSTSGFDPATGDLDIDNGAHVTLTGAGASSTVINPARIDRAFAVQGGAALSISGVTVENGAQPNTSPSHLSTSPGNGGAFYNDGSLSIDSSVLTGNSAKFNGGAVYADADASLTSVTNSTVTTSTAGQAGGALYIESGAITLTGDTLTHNTADSNGGLLDDEESGHTVGTVTIGSSTIAHNVADSDGGAIDLDDAGATNISNSTFNSNTTASSSGGAIEVDGSGLLTVTGSTFNANSSGGASGGAIDVDGSDVSVTASTFTANQGEAGGAIYVDGPSDTAIETIDTSTFTDNSGTSSSGGAIYADEGSLAVTNSTFSGNSTAEDGGGLAYESADAMTLDNDTFDGNQANEGGGVYFSENATTGTVALLNDTIARNSAYEGGGIYDPEDANSVQNTIVADNSGGTGSSGGGDCYFAATGSAGSADQDGNVDSDGTCFSVAGHTHDQINVDPLLGQLSDNGGPTETDLLQPGSPAIGNAVASACPAADQRGTARSTVQGQCDSGAFQTAPTSLTLANTAPASVTVGYPFNDTITASDGGPGPSTGTTIVDQLPANTTLYGVTPSQGTCTSSGTPATVTCALGVVNNGSAATVSMVVAVSDAGPLTNTATATNDQGSSVNASAMTQINAAAATTTTTPTTNPSGPTAISAGTATGSVSRTGAKLLGQVMTGGQSTAYFFQYGRSSQYGRATGVQQTTTAGSVEANITGLRYRTRYHYRLVAINTAGVSYGADQSFVTAWRVKAKKVGLFTKQAVPTNRPHRYTLAGKLTLPQGITKTEGCSGSVTITITSGAKRLASHKVKVSRTCSYKTTFSVNKKLTGHGKLRARARFGGNLTLSSTKSKTITLRYG